MFWKAVLFTNLSNILKVKPGRRIPHHRELLPSALLCSRLSRRHVKTRWRQGMLMVLVAEEKRNKREHEIEIPGERRVTARKRIKQRAVTTQEAAVEDDRSAGLQIGTVGVRGQLMKTHSKRASEKEGWEFCTPCTWDLQVALFSWQGIVTARKQTAIFFNHIWIAVQGHLDITTFRIIQFLTPLLEVRRREIWQCKLLHICIHQFLFCSWKKTGSEFTLTTQN